MLSEYGPKSTDVIGPGRLMFSGRYTYPSKGMISGDTHHQGWLEIAALGALHADDFRRSEEKLLVACGGRLRLGLRCMETRSKKRRRETVDRTGAAPDEPFAPE